MTNARLFRGVVPAELAGDRLDRALARLAPTMSRGQARRLIDEGCVFVAGKRTRLCGRLLVEGETLDVYRPAVQRAALAPRVIEANRAWVVVDKPVGMPVEPTQRGSSGTLLAWLGRELDGEVFVAHRLDVATSGLIVLARHRAMLAALNAAFAARHIDRAYLAVVSPAPTWTTCTLDAPLDGKQAVTHATVKTVGEGAALLELTLETGRTNQIRRHLTGAGHPVVGDRSFGGASAARLLLHAYKLSWAERADETDGPGLPRRTFTCPPGPDFEEAARPFALMEGLTDASREGQDR